MSEKQKYWRHLKTITKHKLIVGWECWKVGLYWQGLMHDWSKFGTTEFFTSAKYFQGDKTPIGAEKAERGYSIAWLNHKAKNKHHWEYWVDFRDGEILCCPIPEKYLREMACDMIGASKVYSKNYKPGDAHKYFMNNNHTWHMLPKNKKVLGEFLIKYEF